MMKKIYTAPEVTVEELLKQDVLCASMEVEGENRRAAFDEISDFFVEDHL